MLGVLLALSCALIVLERTTGWKLFKFVPGMVLMYLLCATLNSLGVFGQDDATREPIAQVKDVLLPAMILLFLFGCDLRKIIRLGPKLLLTMFVASASLSPDDRVRAFRALTPRRGRCSAPCWPPGPGAARTWSRCRTSCRPRRTSSATR